MSCEEKHADGSDSVTSRELKCGSAELKLFDPIAALAQKGEHTVGAAHMSRTGDNEVGLSAAQVSFDFRNPFAIPICQEPISK